MPRSSHEEGSFMLLICCLAVTTTIIVLGAALPSYESRPDALRDSGQALPSTVTLNTNGITASIVMVTNQQMPMATNIAAIRTANTHHR
jgi:hypothetical protein